MSNSISGIYKIKNTVSGKFYIGSAININKRWINHISDLNKNKHPNRHLQAAWNKYGAEAFEFTVIESCFVFALIFREQHYIDTLKPEYNLSKKAGSNFGMKYSPESIINMSEGQKKRFSSQDEINKLSKSHIGHIATNETRQKMRETTKGMYRGWADKSILQYSRDGILLECYKSIMDAERKTGIPNQAIVRCARGGRPTAGGFIWRYADENE